MKWKNTIILGTDPFTWNIPWKWWVEGTTNVELKQNGWQEVFTIDASGTVTVSKFSHKVTRQITEPTGTAN